MSRSRVIDPSIDRVHRELNPDDIGEALREELDVHSAFTWEKFLREGLDAHFNARTVSDGAQSLATSSDYWTQESYKTPHAGYVTCPAEVDSLAIYSKKAFNYGHLACEAVIPSVAGYKSGAGVYLGFENGAGGGTGMASFRFYTDGVKNFCRLEMGTVWPWSTVDVTALLPADYLTTKHVYEVELTRSMGVFYVDGNAVAYGLFTPNSRFTSILGPPYALFATDRPLAPSITTLIEVSGFGKELKLLMSPRYFRGSDGDPLPPRVIRAYDAGTSNLFAGLVIAAGSETSHPIPTNGHGTKTFSFRADQAGTLLIETLMQTNNWRTYDTLNVLANTFLPYVMTGAAALARLTFTPSAYPCTISEAEVALQ